MAALLRMTLGDQGTNDDAPLHPKVMLEEVEWADDERQMTGA
ncbi:hypothetical protein [Bradyrhizobium manausense]|nr:hypothetical protein [Bradyrhizobium manausense]